MEWWQRGLNGLWNVGKDTAAGAVMGSAIPGVGNVLGAVGGGLYGLYDAFAQDQQAEQAQAAQQQPQGLAAPNPAVQQAQQRLEGQYNDVASRANPYVGEAWRPAFNQQAQGLAGNYATQEARGLAQAGATGGQGGATTTAAIRAAHGNALSALQANTQMHYQDMGNQWQNAHDASLGGLASGLYSNAVGLDNQAYQRGQDDLGRQDRANANFGAGLGGAINAGLTFAGTENGGKAIGAGVDYLRGLAAPATPALNDTTQPTSYGDGGAMQVQPRKDTGYNAMKQPKRGLGGY